MLKRNKAIAIALAFVFCMSFIAPALVAPSVAQAAAVDYSYSGPAEFSTKSDLANAQLMIAISDALLLPVVGGDVYASNLTITLPSEVKFENVNPTVKTDTDKVDVTNPHFSNGNTTDGWRTITYDVANHGTTSAKGSAKIIIPLNNVKVGNGSDELNISVGGTGIFQNGGTVSMGKIVSDGSFAATVDSVKTIGDGTSPIGDIIITENSACIGNKLSGALSGNLKITIDTDDFYWDITTPPTVTGQWGMTGTVLSSSITASDEVLTIPLTGLTRNSGIGRIVISGASIDSQDPDDTGEIIAKVEAPLVDDEVELVVAKYGTYNVAVTEDTVKEVTAGKNDAAIGSFIIEEEVGGSFVDKRTVTFELPSGVKWTKNPRITVQKGDKDLEGSGDFIKDSKGRTLKYTVDGSKKSRSKLLIEKGEVYIEPGFEGPIEVTVGGSAGVEGTVKVAEVKPAVTIKAEGVKDVVVGSQNQQVADILIVENDKEAILKDGQIVVALDEGYKFYKKPVVEVTEGDLEIDSTKLNSDNDELTIKIKDDSSAASTIKLSDVYVTGFRSAPEGPVKAILVEATSSNDGSTALDEGYKETWGDNLTHYSETSAGDVVVANCVTPANSGANISFKVGSNIYTVNGVNKVMDASPYIKGDRTYVPMRYMAETLGAEVVWDQTAQTVTLTKGDTVVVFTIGSTTYTVNGESAVADVAPEITSDRTMLPARYAAEALGAVVGWDQATQTVIITQ